MRTVTSIRQMSAAAARAKADGRTIGFVPTMGFLHQGHLSLVRECRKRADVTVVSIFVNPLQFGPREDFRDYPRDRARDAALLEREKVDYLFCPEAEEMYPPGFRTSVEVRDLQAKLCGCSRPGHFKGVTTVVLKLFEIVRPDIAFFGQKDAQQALIIKRMASDLNLGVRVEVRPIVREPDGLAMSSRNTYLGPEERRAALVLWRSLEAARRDFLAGERRSEALIRRMSGLISQEPLARVDYIAVVQPETLEPVDLVEGETLVALAVYVGRTRLIDNIVLKPLVRHRHERKIPQRTNR
jgi:pantoate--beta-alanine ligase